MAFQAEQVLLSANEHLRIHRTVRLMTAHAILPTHCGMLKGERSAVIRMALGACDFVAEGCFHLSWIQPAVGRVAVDAVDRTFLQAMPEGLGEGCLYFLMTG